MPRYFFNMVDGERNDDDCGVTLGDDRAAFREAIKFAGLSLASDPSLLTDSMRFGVEVVNDCGIMLFVVNVVTERKNTPPDISAASPAWTD